MMLCRHVVILLWLPGNAEIIGKSYGWDNGLHGRWSPSKQPSVIKTIHSRLRVNMKQKRFFLFHFWDCLFNILGFNVYSKCWH